MAKTVIGNLLAILRLDSKQFGKDINRSNKLVGTLGDSVKKLALGLAGLFGARALINGLKESVRLFGEQELAERRMAEGLKLAGDTAASSLDDFKRFASEIQTLTTFGDEAVLQIAALGASLGRMSGQQLKDATKAALGLAKVAEIDAASAMKLLARAAQGGTVDFSRYGIVVDKTKSKQEQFNEVLRVGIEGFAVARAEADTTAGKLQQLSNSIGDLKEQLGGLVAVPLTDFVKDLQALADTNRLVGKIGVAEGAATIFDLIPGLGGQAQEMRNIADMLRTVEDRNANESSNRSMIQQRLAAGDAILDQRERDAARRRSENIKKYYGITGGEFFDFSARSGLFDFDTFKQRMGIDSPISDLTKGLFSGFSAAQPTQDTSSRFLPQFAGALTRGSTAEYSARLAAMGGGREERNAKETADNTLETADNTSELVRLFRNFQLSSAQTAQVVTI